MNWVQVLSSASTFNLSNSCELGACPRAQFQVPMDPRSIPTRAHAPKPLMRNLAFCGLDCSQDLTFVTSHKVVTAVVFSLAEVLVEVREARLFSSAEAFHVAFHVAGDCGV